jgi:hypothetical protein
MESKRYEEPQRTHWLFRVVIPASAWAMLAALFALASWLSLHEPGLTMDAEPSLSMLSETAVQLTASHVAPSGPGADAVDRAVTELEVLDPVGAGHDPAP